MQRVVFDPVYLSSQNLNGQTFASKFLSEACLNLSVKEEELGHQEKGETNLIILPSKVPHDLKVCRKKGRHIHFIYVHFFSMGVRKDNY